MPHAPRATAELRVKRLPNSLPRVRDESYGSFPRRHPVLAAVIYGGIAGDQIPVTRMRITMSPAPGTPRREPRAGRFKPIGPRSGAGDPSRSSLKLATVVCMIVVYMNDYCTRFAGK